jgi:outer membrane protein
MHFLLLLLLLSSSAWGQVSRNFNKTYKPMYEIGAGFAYFRVANYPGSKNNSYKFIPFPIAIYRGEKLRADEDGTRARFINSDWVELGMSGGFNFPIKTEDNEVRKGMPDTGALLGIGPAVIFKIFKNSHQKLNAGIGLRVNLEDGVFPYFAERGWIIEPTLRYWYKPSSESALTIFSGLSFSAADQKYNAFYYQVDTQYERPNRAAYSAKQGVVDMAYSLGITYDVSAKTSLFIGGVYSNLTTAANKDSPLLETQHNYSFGLGITWLFLESEQMVK